MKRAAGLRRLLALSLLAAAWAEKPPSPPPSLGKPAKPPLRLSADEPPSARPSFAVEDEDDRSATALPALAESPGSGWQSFLAPLSQALGLSTHISNSPLRLPPDESVDGDAELKVEAEESGKMSWLSWVALIVVQIAVRMIPHLLGRRRALRAAAQAGAEAVGQAAEGISSIPAPSATAGYPSFVVWLMKLKSKFAAWARSPQAAPVMLSLLIFSMKLVKRFDSSLVRWALTQQTNITFLTAVAQLLSQAEEDAVVLQTGDVDGYTSETDEQGTSDVGDADDLKAEEMDPPVDRADTDDI
ncbi:MAG: hypothetical protein SGPRY_014440, partial [Prymnesium sp.]